MTKHSRYNVAEVKLTMLGGKINDWRNTCAYYLSNYGVRRFKVEERICGKDCQTYRSFNLSFRILSHVSNQESRLCEESIAAAETPRFFKAST